MTAHDPRVTLTEAERTRLRMTRIEGPHGAHLIAGPELGGAWLDALAEQVERIIAARLAPIRALADDAAALYDDRLAEVAALPPGSVGRRLHSMLGDLAHAALSAPVSASQDHDGAEGQGEVPWSRQRVHIHPPYEPTCNERRVDGQLLGACLNDDGSPR